MEALEQTQGERALIAALEAGCDLTPNFYNAFCSGHDLNPDIRVEIRADFLRALLIVEGAHLTGRQAPHFETQRLKAYGVDPSVRRVAYRLAIDWSGMPADFDQAAITQEAENIEDKQARARWISQEYAWRSTHDLADRPHILGDCDLSGILFPASLVLNTVDFRDPVHGRMATLALNAAKIGSLALAGAAVMDISGSEIECETDLYFPQILARCIDLRFCTVGGTLLLSGARLTHPTGRTLNCDGAVIRGAVRMRSGFSSFGEVNFIGARVGGQFSCEAGKFINSGKIALWCNQARIESSVFLVEGFESEGQVNFSSAHVQGSVECYDAALSNPGKTALECHRIQVESDVRLIYGFFATGKVCFTDGKIDGHLACDGARFSNPDGYALECSGIQIGGSAFLGNGFEAHGEVNFTAALIKGYLACESGKFFNKAKVSLKCNGAEIGGSALLRNGFSSKGEVNFVGARIGGQMSCQGARFSNSGQCALQCNGIQITDSLFISEGFISEGEVNFIGAKISDGIFSSGAKLLNPGKIAFVCAAARIQSGLHFFPDLVDGDVDLSNTHCALLSDNLAVSGVGPFKQRTWLSKDGKLILDGFRYDRLSPESPKSWSERRDWLNLQPKSDRKGKGFRPQPFEQLAAVLREMGYTSDARDVALAKQWRMHISGKLSWPAWVFRLLILAPSGYGYRPAWPALAGLLLILFTACVFELAYRDGHMTPAQPHGALTRVAELLETHNDGETCRLVETTSSLPDFHAIAYAVDAFVPFVDLDQVASWKPSASARCVEGLDQINPPPALMAWTSAWTPSVAPWAERGWLDLLKWLVTGFGVAITGLVALSLSGLLKRD